MFLVTFLIAWPLHAEPGAQLVVPESAGWTGQRMPFFIDLRADGSFTGAAAFDLPEIANTAVIKIGNPILSSESDGDAETFIQRHEFALFSQAEGPVTIPQITARFSHKKGYTGPSTDSAIDTKPATLTLRRPPGSENLGFIVTTDSLKIDESWDPEPGPLGTGAVLKRTITQRAEQMTGMALSPAPHDAPEGIRVYPGEPETRDRTERGEFFGERRETITYLVQQPGLYTLPAIRYHWWNPQTETLESQTLPAVTFTATSPPPPPQKPSPVRFLWFLIPLIFLAASLSFRKPLGTLLHRLRERYDPPSRRATRAFLKSCRSNDPQSAARNWAIWRRLRPDFAPSPEFQHHLLQLHQHLYGPKPASTQWLGHALASSFRASARQPSVRTSTSPLPELNP